MSRVFVVYGRDREAYTRLTNILNSLGIEVLDWEGAIELSGKPAPYAKEVLETAMRNVDAVVILMSGDEEARLRPALCSDYELVSEGALQPQARPNVIFEAGMAFALFPNKTILVQLGRIRQISDLGGVQYVLLDPTEESTQALIKRLRNAGCRVTAGSPNVPKGDLPNPEQGLPIIEKTNHPQRAKLGLFRQLRALLPIPGLGGSIEVVTEATIGEMVTLSIETPDSAAEYQVWHWLPGHVTPMVVNLNQAQKAHDGTSQLALKLSGPAGMHYFDLLVKSSAGEPYHPVGRTGCAVAER